MTMTSQKLQIYNRAFQERERLRGLLWNALGKQTGQERGWESQISELSWVINDGFPSRSVQAINREFDRRGEDALNRLGDAQADAILRLHALRTALGLTESEFNQKLFKTVSPAGYTQRGVKMVFRAVEVQKQMIYEFEIVGYQNATCPFCGKVNTQAEGRYATGEMIGKAYPFTIEMPETACLHYKFAQGSVNHENWMVFEGSVKDTIEYKTEQARREEEFNRLEEELLN